MLDHVEDLVQLPGAEFAKIKSALKDKFGRPVTLRDLGIAVTQARRKRHRQTAINNDPHINPYRETAARHCLGQAHAARVDA